jgi:hypothetical protein
MLRKSYEKSLALVAKLKIEAIAKGESTAELDELQVRIEGIFSNYILATERNEH